MKRVLSIFRTLIYYDGPEVFIGEDEINQKYLCIRIPDHEKPIYLCVPVSRYRLSDFLHAKFDLLKVITESECEEIFLSEEATASGFNIQSISINQIIPEWLPEPGFLFQQELFGEKVINDAVEKNKAICFLSMEPSESRSEARVKSKNLVLIVDAFQSFVKNAFKKSMASLEKKHRDLIDTANNFELEVYGVGRGSFTIYFESPGEVDPFGYAEIEKAFSKIDVITKNIGDANKSLPVLRENKGLVVSSYKKLLKTIIENNIPITYTWAIPESKIIHTCKITIENANPIYDLLNEKTDLENEEIVLVGHVSKADHKTGSWTFQNIMDGKEYKGYCNPDYAVDLSGVVIQTQKYKFNCTEILKQEIVSQNEETKLVLNNFEVLNE